MQSNLDDINVLIIEDEAMIAWMFQSILEDMGFKSINVASNSIEAHEFSKKSTPHLIISDINLGEGPDGIETSREIVARSSATVIFVSAYADDSTQDRIKDFIPQAKLLRKPLMDVLLERAVKSALETLN